MIRCRRKHFVPRPRTAHDVEPKFRQAIELEDRAIGFLQEPGFLLHFGLELTRFPTGITYKCTDRASFLTGRITRLLKVDVVIELKPLAFFPFQRRKHELVFPDWSAQKNRNTRQSFGWCFIYEIRHLFIERAINDDTECAVVWIVRRNEQDRAAKIWIEHIRMSHEQ